MPSRPQPSVDVSAASRSGKASGSFLLKLDITIPAIVTAITPLVETAMAAVRRHSKSRELAVETALREALANAIKHGCCENPSLFVQCSVVLEDDRNVLIVVSDPGPGFDPKLIPDPTNGEHLYENHGRGIYLINHLMDEVQYKRRGAEIHMRIHG